MKFKVGDAVRVISLVGWSDQEANFFLGREGIITAIDSLYMEVNISDGSRIPMTLWLEEELELVV